MCAFVRVCSGGGGGGSGCGGGGGGSGIGGGLQHFISYHFHHLGGGGGSGDGDYGGSGGSCGISWDELLLTDSSISVFIGKADEPMDGRMDQWAEPLIELRGERDAKWQR